MKTAVNLNPDELLSASFNGSRCHVRYVAPITGRKNRHRVRYEIPNKLKNEKPYTRFATVSTRKLDWI